MNTQKLCCVALIAYASSAYAELFTPDFEQYKNNPRMQQKNIDWNTYTDLVTNYGMPIRINDYGKIMLNTSNIEKLFINMNMKHDSVSSVNDSIVVRGDKRIDVDWDRVVKVDSPFKNAEVALNQCIPPLFAHIGTCTRPNTVGRGIPPLAISNANFVVHFTAGLGDVSYCFNNIYVFMDITPNAKIWEGEYKTLSQVDKRNFTSSLFRMTENNYLVVANRINSLFDGDVASLSKNKNIKVSKSKEMTLSIAERKTLPEGESVTLRWSVPSDLKDCWIRFDTSEGRASIGDEKAQTVTVSHILAKTPVTATLYAISPDGKEWRYTALEIPATKK